MVMYPYQPYYSGSGGSGGGGSPQYSCARCPFRTFTRSDIYGYGCKMCSSLSQAAYPQIAWREAEEMMKILSDDLSRQEKLRSIESESKWQADKEFKMSLQKTPPGANGSTKVEPVVTPKKPDQHDKNLRKVYWNNRMKSGKERKSDSPNTLRTPGP